LQHLQHGHALARWQRRRVDPQAVVAALPMLGRTAGARHVVLRGLRERRERGLDRWSRPDKGHGSLILNIRPVSKFFTFSYTMPARSVSALVFHP
jgi:phage tail tape-measure protein